MTAHNHAYHLRRVECANCGHADYSWRAGMPLHRCPEEYQRGCDGLYSDTAAQMVAAAATVQGWRRA